MTRRCGFSSWGVGVFRVASEEFELIIATEIHCGAFYGPCAHPAQWCGPALRNTSKSKGLFDRGRRDGSGQRFGCGSAALESTSAPSMRRARILFSGAGRPSKKRLNQGAFVVAGVARVVNNFLVAAPPRWVTSAVTPVLFQTSN
jgi:hypothetical protein